MSIQNRYTKSIKPKSIEDLRDLSKFNEFIDYFNNHNELFINSCLKFVDLIFRFSEIRNELVSKKLYDDFLNRVENHSRLAKYKLTPIQKYIDVLWNNYLINHNEITTYTIDKIGKNITFPPTQEQFNLLDTDEKELIQKTIEKLNDAYLNFMAIITGFINSIFFAFETECKIICSLGCFAFSINYAQGNIIQHNDIWQTLKRLGSIEFRESIMCEICKMKTHCKFSINFEALANVYCYAIKVRMLADYDELFFKNQIWELLKNYFNNLNDIINNQEKIIKKCVEEV